MTSADLRNDDGGTGTGEPGGGEERDEQAGPDPFERLNQAMGVGEVTNPYPELAELRARHDVVPPEEGRDIARLRPEMAAPAYTAVSYDAVNEILRDGRRFSSSRYGRRLERAIGPNLVEMDEPEHNTYRKLIQQAFGRRAMERWEPEVVRPVIDERLDAMIEDAGADRRVELMRQLTSHLPITVIAGLLDLPGDQLRRFHTLAIRLFAVTFDLEDAQQASAELAEMLRPLVAARRPAPGDDVISLLTAAEHDGQRLTEDEILTFCRLLLLAGADTPFRAASNLLVGLLTHPDQLDAVRADHGLLPQAIEEGVRWECPVLPIYRVATQDTEVCGVPIPEGAVVCVQLGAANHDDRYWDHPERFDIFRPQPQTPLGFGTGPHLCLGMHLASLEIRLLLQRLFERLPGLRLDPDQPPPAITGRGFRAPAAIHAIYDPA